MKAKPSRKAQRINDTAHYYEAAKSIEVYIQRLIDGRWISTKVRIPWKMLLKSLERSDMERPR